MFMYLNIEKKQERVQKKIDKKFIAEIICML
jgi:hypothetical protein